MLEWSDWTLVSFSVDEHLTPCPCTPPPRLCLQISRLWPVTPHHLDAAWPLHETRLTEHMSTSTNLCRWTFYCSGRSTSWTLWAAALELIDRHPGQCERVGRACGWNGAYEQKIGGNRKGSLSKRASCTPIAMLEKNNDNQYASNSHHDDSLHFNNFQGLENVQETGTEIFRSLAAH